MEEYEVMFILRPDLNESERKDMFGQIKDTLNKFSTKLNSGNIWAEKRKLFFDLGIKGKGVKFRDALYYLVEFQSQPQEIKKITAAYRLNENILRFLISAKDQMKPELMESAKNPGGRT